MMDLTPGDRTAGAFPEVSERPHLDHLPAIDDDGARDPAVAGGKAASLAELRAAGHRVPVGFIVPVGICATLLSGARTPEDVAQVPDGLREALDARLAELGGGPVAVRSSAVAEDLREASYAGQYETILEVEDADDLAAAVRTCAASALATRVGVYTETAADLVGPGGPDIAVLVQRQLRPEAAGVAFSANPVTGDRDETLVSAVRGVGERLVAGETTPDEWVVRDGEPEAVARPEGAVIAEQARAVAALAERLEEERGVPQDVEWAWADGELWVLQSRAITALPRPPELDIPGEGSWSKDTVHHPEPLTPLGASVYVGVITGAAQEDNFERFGLLFERLEARSLGGEIYLRIVPPGGREVRWSPPWWLLAIAARLVPPVRARMRAARRALRGGLLERISRRWEERWRDEFRSDAERLRSVDLDALDDAGLEAHLDEAVALFQRGYSVHFQLFIPHLVGIYELVRTCEELLGWDLLETLDLLAGLSETSSAPVRALHDLADRIRGHPDAEAALSAGVDLRRALAGVAPGTAAALDRYLEAYGQRALNYDPGVPTLAERPDLVAALLRSAVAADPDDVTGLLAARRREAEERARAHLDGAPAEVRARFERVLEVGRRVYPQREDNVFWTVNVPCGLIRRAVVEVGRRLTARRQAVEPDDAAYLEPDELRAALRGDASSLVERAGRRRAERAWVAAHPGPAVHGDEPLDADALDLRGLPAEGRLLHQALLWGMGAELRAAAHDDGGLRGVPGSPGRYTGPARIITSQADFDRLRPGDVLVCPVTTPVWSVLFAQSGAVVTDGGGALSHPAIIAREHAIPAVLATGDATARLTDGELVTVDGAAGTVVPQEQSL